MSIDDDYKIILDSNKFDEEYYRVNYNIDENVDAIYHYLLFGVDMNYNPSEEFDTKFYLDEHLDVKNRGINPFVHYIKWGESEGRLSKSFDFQDVKENFIYNNIDLLGKDDFIFPFDLNFELLQHYDLDYLKSFNRELFLRNLSFKRVFFKKYGIKYDFFVIPDKSVVCERFLPFKHEVPLRLINDLGLFDFAEYLNETHYLKGFNSFNSKGNKLFFLKLISSIDCDLDEEELCSLLDNHILELSKCDANYGLGFNHFNGNFDVFDSFFQKPLHLYESVVSDELFDGLDVEPVYQYNEDSYSDSRALIFYNSDIDGIKYFLSFYFREVLLFFDYGALNRDAIKWFAPDVVLELRNENFIPFYNDSDWVNNSVDFLEDCGLQSSNLNLLESDGGDVEISVIIPIYNVEKYLGECLDSVINQTFGDIEIICINDGSTDNCLDIIKTYAKLDDRIVIINTVNHGLGAARNFGLRQARGKYVFFIDSDDLIDEKALELLHAKAIESDLDMTFYQLINFVDDEGTLIKDITFDHICFQHDNLDEKPFFTLDDVKDYLFEIPVCACSKLYKKSFLDSIDFEFPEGVYYEDNEKFYYSFLKSNKVGFVKEYLLYRRIHRDSITGQFREKQIDVIDVMNKVISVFIDGGKYEFFKERLINHTFADVFAIFNTAPLSFKQTFFDRIKKEFMGFNELKHDFEDNLNDDFKLVFNLFNNNDFYIHFDSQYRLSIAKYTIFTGKDFISVGSEEYVNFRNSDEKESYEIGVVIPIYNNGNITHRTVMSLENQTFNFEDIEILLINDNSSDGTAEIINEYAEKYPNVKAIHINENSGGPGTPRNIGIRECTSEYIMFLDHDDFFEVDALERLYVEISSFKSDVVFGAYSEIVDKQPRLRVYADEKSGYFENLSQNERFIALPPPSIWTKMFKTSFIRTHNILFPTILGEDTIFMMYVLLYANGIVFLKDKNICFHDLRDTSTTNNVSLKYLQELFVSELYMYEIFEKIGKLNYCKHRAGIIDFALNQLSKSKLDSQELIQIFDLMKRFLMAHNRIDSKPRLPANKILFDIILNNDIMTLEEYLGIC